MNTKKFSLPLLAAFVAVGFSACSSSPKKNTVEMSKNSPTVLNARVEPGTVILNGELQPVNPAQVLADIKDFNSHVTDVRLKFMDVPLEVPMDNVAGTTWKAELTPQELQMLAVSGKTVKYRAGVIAKNAQGSSSEIAPVTVAVKAPDYAHQFG